MHLRVPLLPRWLRWSAVLAVAAFVFYASVVTAPPETALDAARPSLVPLDKWRHFLAYAAVGYALAYATTDWDARSGLVAAVVIGTTIAYGVGLELAQSVTPDRYFSLGDAYANALGGVLAVPFYVLRPSLEFVPLRRYVRSVTARLRSAFGDQ